MAAGRCHQAPSVCPTDFIRRAVSGAVNSEVSDGLSGCELGAKNQQLRSVSSDGLCLSESPARTRSQRQALTSRWTLRAEGASGATVCAALTGAVSQASLLGEATSTACTRTPALISSSSGRHQAWASALGSRSSSTAWWLNTCMQRGMPGSAGRIGSSSTRSPDRAASRSKASRLRATAAARSQPERWPPTRPSRP